MKSHPSRPKGMPRALYKEACSHPVGSKRAARFFDNWFANNGGGGVGVTQTNSGTQNIGVGNSAASGKRARALATTRMLRDVLVDTGHNNNPGAAPIPQVITSVTTSKTNKTLVFQEREMFTPVNGSTQFGSLAFPINPGLSTMFPKGSQISSNYEKYRITSLEIEYVPIVSGYSVDGQQGRVVLGFSPDPIELPPQDLQAAESMDPNVSGMPYDRLRLRLTPAQFTGSQPQRYVRTSRNPAGTDLKTYDPGVFYFSVQGCVNGTQIGELHITYTFELMNIRVGAAPVLPPNQTLFLAQLEVMQTVTPGVVALVSVPGIIMDGLGVTIEPVPGMNGFNALRFPPGRYFVTITFGWEYAVPGFSISGAAAYSNQNISGTTDPFSGRRDSVISIPCPNTFSQNYQIVTASGWRGFIVEDNTGTNGFLYLTSQMYVTGGTASASVYYRIAVQVA